jgi:enoyl-CoA hydratase/carnithine racemase
MSSETVLLSITGPIATIRLNRPDKRNAIDLTVLAGLDDALERIEREPGVRIVLLSAAGDTFSGGGDIKAWAELDPQAFAHGWIKRGHAVFDRLARLRFPTVAVLGGDALGGGLELAACCDFRIAEAQARLGLPEAGLGMVPGWSGTQRLARRFGVQIVRRMALGSELFSAEQALAAGVVDKVVGRGEGLQAAEAYAGAVLARGSGAGQAVKLMLAIAEGEGGEAALDILSGAMIAPTAELREGVAAFREKRRPDFNRSEEPRDE